MELKFNKIKKADESKYKLYREDEKLMVKTFLTIEEISDITNSCLSENDAIKRMIIKLAKMVEYATNVDLANFKKEDETIDADMIYNTFAEKNWLEFVYRVTNYEDISNIMYDVENTYNVLKAFANNMEQQLAKIDTKEMVNGLKNTLVDFKNQSEIHEHIFENNK